MRSCQMLDIPNSQQLVRHRLVPERALAMPARHAEILELLVSFCQLVSRLTTEPKKRTDRSSHQVISPVDPRQEYTTLIFRKACYMNEEDDLTFSESSRCGCRPAVRNHVVIKLGDFGRLLLNYQIRDYQFSVTGRFSLPMSISGPTENDPQVIQWSWSYVTFLEQTNFEIWTNQVDC